MGRHALFSSTNSKATQASVKRAKNVLFVFAPAHDSPDPVRITPNSSLLVLNLLAKYCKFGSPQSLKDDSMGALVQGLRIVYEQHGHHQNWMIDDMTGEARGNPLNGNKDITFLRRAHRVHITRYGGMSLKERPITGEITCDHAELFRHMGNKMKSTIDVRDIELHCLVLGIRLGLRFNEIGKLDTDHVSVMSVKITLTLTVSIKNSTVQRYYTLQ